ncbi:MAG TPA: glycosyltransferase [Candidatus Paceibacterota bacterium]|nr:glycosyltransferase [Candidatus Paceibacterota bacterium]
MNVLMISGDRNLLREGTGGYKRLMLQKSKVDRLDVFVWPQVHSWSRIAAAAATKRYDVITSQDPFWRGLFSAFLAWRNGLRLNIQVHADLAASSGLRRTVARFVLRRADSIRVVSDRLAPQIMEIGVRGRLTVLPVYLDVERFRAVKRRPSETPTILWIGRYESEKDPFAAIAVFDEVAKHIPDVQLLMIGEGSLRDKLIEQAAQRRGVRVLGWMEPSMHLAAANVVLSTSRHESWGASIIESLGAGVPVVSLDVGIAREAGAITVPREKLADAVIDVLRTRPRGALNITLPDENEWARRWKESL